MNFKDFLANGFVLLDGGTGTLLQAEGLAAGEHPERLNITHPDVISDIGRRYYDAGSNVICTNTFGASRLRFSSAELEVIIPAAVACAKAARESSSGRQEKFIALDIGPTGRLLAPLGDLDFEEAVSVFAETVRLGVAAGVDLILIETMTDAYETKAAVLAARENCDLPIVVTNAYGADGKLMTGASPAAMVALLEGLGVSALGANCSLGPRGLVPVAEELLATASLPVVLKPNAGLPEVCDGKTVYNVAPDEFAAEIAPLLDMGVRAVGGCCGTTPAYITALSAELKGREVVPVTDKARTVVSSYTHAVCFGEEPILIGERINPTGKKRFKQALYENDIGYILTEGVNQQEKGVAILDVNVGLPDIDEVAMLTRCVAELQAVTDLPLQIDTASPTAMEKALRRYNGKPMINSVNGKRESMAAVFPLVKKYGGVVVALTLDEDGIPADAQGRIRIAEKILQTAAEYGIARKDIVFDTLAMTVSADRYAARETLSALRYIKNELGCHTSLGVSNISFGLPVRDAVNSTFFALALANGLSAAIMNPYSAEMMKTYHSYRALAGLDENCTAYIAASENFAVAAQSAAPTAKTQGEAVASELQNAILRGFKERAGELATSLLATHAPLDIINSEIVPALDRVGVGFENKTVYLPQLLMSAEAAGAAFESVKAAMAAKNESTADKGIFVLATVEGDIHDIGKNIVRLLLENYGYRVIDLGRDVPPARVVETVLQTGAPLVGLSALMTTTVPAMEATVRALHEAAPTCRVVVGGAVLTAEYAARIGADKYASDAMETVRYAEEVMAVK